MDLALLNNDDPDPALMARYIKGATAFDHLWLLGVRCPSNPDGVRCGCLIKANDYCKYFDAVEKLGLQLGGAISAMIRGMK